MKRSSVPLLLLLGGAAWTAGQGLLPDMGLEWEARLDAVSGARSAQSLSAALFIVSGALLVAAALATARMPAAGRGSTALRIGALLLGLGGIWLAAGRGAFNLQMYRLTDPGVSRDAALAVASADVGPGFLALLPALPALLLGPLVLAIGAWRAGAAGRLPQLALMCWVLGIGTFIATEFTVKAGEVVGVSVASLGLVLLGSALSRGTVPSPTAGAVGIPAPSGDVPASRRGAQRTGGQVASP
jgi:hypothetical protein